ncbi:anti-sigma regulatory factor [Brevibacillus sp. SYP-B805]|uniref:anti-sigma regulatory factor n=1 Tax=Brevibacillus sp. SYP-B805 TaxID=1578199 RepID=UPI0013EC9BEF|nr:anti-sigma regulatory factor [Brevibacillus sp. SYP-B805]NGQ96049.1 anti-sigma regulatory factor [Brevibacillus sp. SYP-B805]
MTVPITIEIRTEQDIVLARQEGRNLSKQLGFGNIVQSRIATAISELARNIFQYAGAGTITIETVKEDGRVGVRIVAEDHGPGIRDIRRAMEDGFSTSGGLGAGLPGVRRMMDEFSIESSVDHGTRVVIIKWNS